jgi:hypothetical protein
MIANVDLVLSANDPIVTSAADLEGPRSRKAALDVQMKNVVDVRLVLAHVHSV